MMGGFYWLTISIATLSISIFAGTGVTLLSDDFKDLMLLGILLRVIGCSTDVDESRSKLIVSYTHIYRLQTEDDQDAFSDIFHGVF